MEKYKFNEMTVGLSKSFSVKITRDMHDMFFKMSGDVNPLHRSEEFARKQGYGECVVYGFCTASLYSTLVGVYLPGENCLLQQCDISWLRPVFVGDELEVSGTVVDINETFRRVRIKASIVRKSDGVKVSRAKIVVGVLN